MSTPENLQYLEVEAKVRYWEDATINGAEDIGGTLIPLKTGNLWKPVIELATGRVLEWPKGTIAHIHYKVCDAGKYWLLDENRNRLRQWAGDYVPDRFLCVGDSGFGDYIILNIDAEGMIEGWKQPEIKAEQWEAIQSEES